MRKIAHQIIGRTAASPAGAHGYFALFYKREHAGQGVFNRLRATIINIAPESDGIGDITPAGCARFFKLAQQKSLIGCSWKSIWIASTCGPVMAKMWVARSTNAPVNGWLRKLLISA